MNPPCCIHWSEDDVLHALTLLGLDQVGGYVLGERAVQDAEVTAVYARQANEAMGFGLPGSSAGGEFPKFTAFREVGDVAGREAHVIVKFSGSDGSPGTVRWSDLLVCEHLALCTVASHLDVQAAVSRVFQADGRTFLEVERFDRHGRLGRSAVCSWAALNGALFGQLIANTNMHDGNLAFRPGLSLAPVYDMLPMAYAPMPRYLRQQCREGAAGAAGLTCSYRRTGFTAWLAPWPAAETRPWHRPLPKTLPVTVDRFASWNQNGVVLVSVMPWRPH